MTIRETIRAIPLSYGLWLPAGIVAADQASKWAATRLFDLPMNICAIDPMIRRAGHHYEVSPILDLSMLCNPGISWGLMQGDSPFKRWALLADEFNLDKNLISSRKLSSAPNLVRRPRLMGLANNKICQVLGRNLGSVKDQLKALKCSQFSPETKEIQQQ